MHVKVFEIFAAVSITKIAFPGFQVMDSRIKAGIRCFGLKLKAIIIGGVCSVTS